MLISVSQLFDDHLATLQPVDELDDHVALPMLADKFNDHLALPMLADKFNDHSMTIWPSFCLLTN
jgi:hypothetical protein